MILSPAQKFILSIKQLAFQTILRYFAQIPPFSLCAFLLPNWMGVFKTKKVVRFAAKPGSRSFHRPTAKNLSYSTQAKNIPSSPNLPKSPIKHSFPPLHPLKNTYRTLYR